jgi:hypothetical protein
MFVKMINPDTGQDADVHSDEVENRRRTGWQANEAKEPPAAWKVDIAPATPWPHKTMT